MSQTTDRVEDEKNGSICAVVGSGMRVMSDSLIAFQPAMDEPSNMMPSAKTSSSTMETSKVTCCHLPRGSVKRKSTYLMSLSLIAVSTSLAVFILLILYFVMCKGARQPAGRGVRKTFEHEPVRSESAYSWAFWWAADHSKRPA